MERLYLTYESNCSQIGVLTAPDEDAPDKPAPTPLLPLCHTTQNAQIDITVDLDGNWVPNMAHVVEKADSGTIIPCTEASAGRTSGLCPHPLFDKLQYIAGDYLAYGGETKRDGYAAYMEALGAWCASEHAHPGVCAVYRYLQKGRLIADLIGAGVLQTDSNGKLLTKWTGDKDEMPPIFRQLSDPLSAFVRFCVKDPAKSNWALYQNDEVRQSFIDYQAGLDAVTDLCYVQGAILPRSTSSPSKIRNTGDRAKLISSNDSSGFTYRGRFAEAWQAASIGFETTQKAHNVLKWLIAKQGWKNGEQVILAWGTRDETCPPIMSDSYDLFEQAPESAAVDPAVQADTKAAYADKVNRALAGYGALADANAAVSVLALDSTNGFQGRLSIAYYREFSGGELFHRLSFWYGTCFWHLFKNIPDDAGKKHWVRLTGTPAPLDIIAAAYGKNVGDKLKKATVERLLSCILDGAQLPSDIVANAARRAATPLGMSGWEHEQVLSVACALIRKQRNDRAQESAYRSYRLDTYKEVYSVALNKENDGRSYLFGRLLALADQIESRALLKNEENRQTNAMRFMNQFSLKPLATWRYLAGQLPYYYAKLSDRGSWFQSEIANVSALFKEDDFNNSRLDDTYLLGYYCQMKELRTKKDKKESAPQPVAEEGKD